MTPIRWPIPLFQRTRKHLEKWPSKYWARFERKNHLICPNCKSERWEGELCPQCGLSEKQAFLKLAASYRNSGKPGPATECYEKILRLDPEDKEVRREKALCLVQEAMSRRDAGLFLKSDEALKGILLGDWGWEKGHEQRVSLSACFGELEKLQKEYAKEIGSDPSKKETGEKILETITLARKFSENPPVAETTLGPEESVGLWLRSFWPVILGFFSLPLFVGALPSLREVKALNQYLTIFFAWAFLVFSMVFLFILSLNFYKKNKTK
jgi:tetratricopeptide (TPR) repeat protein